MKILLFFGSGISFPSNLPNVDELTIKVLNDRWHDHSDQTFYRGDHPSDYFQEQNIVPRLQTFLKLLKDFADEYFLSRERSKTNYEDLFYICQQISDDQRHEIDNPVISPFLEKIDILSSELYNPLPHRDELEINLKLLASKSCDFIQCVIWDSLFTNEEPQGLGLLLNLIQNENIDKLDIATLNHDLLIEQLLKNHSVEFTDGFGEAEGDIRYFNPNIFNDSTHKVRIYKLHGSLNWYRFRKIDEDSNLTIDRYGMALNNDRWHCRDENGDFVDNLDGIPIFLTGSYNKLLDYNFGIFKQMHAKFDESLANHDIILMSGYGWNDRGINGRLFEWIFSSPIKKLILLHKNPETDIKIKSRSAMWHRYDGLVSDNRLIPIKKWFSETQIDDINGVIN